MNMIKTPHRPETTAQSGLLVTSRAYQQQHHITEQTNDAIIVRIILVFRLWGKCLNNRESLQHCWMVMDSSMIQNRFKQILLQLMTHLRSWMIMKLKKLMILMVIIKRGNITSQKNQTKVNKKLWNIID